MLMSKVFTLHSECHNCGLKNKEVSWDLKGSTKLSSIASFSAPTTLEGRNQKTRFIHPPPGIFFLCSLSVWQHIPYFVIKQILTWWLIPQAQLRCTRKMTQQMNSCFMFVDWRLFITLLQKQLLLTVRQIKTTVGPLSLQISRAFQQSNSPCVN